MVKVAQLALSDNNSFIVWCFHSFAEQFLVKVWNMCSSSAALVGSRKLSACCCQMLLMRAEMEVSAHTQSGFTLNWPAHSAKPSGTAASSVRLNQLKMANKNKHRHSSATIVYWPTWCHLSLWRDSLAVPVNVRVCFCRCSVSNLNTGQDLPQHRAQPSLVFCSSCLIHAVACSRADDRAGNVWL